MASHKGYDKKKEIILSIIIPVYNVEKYIEKCLTSIVEQDVENVEVILINDGSVDDSGRICEKYCEKYHYMRVFHQNNQGLSMARNRGLAVASGKYVLFLDSDDYLNNDILDKLLEVLLETKEDIIVGKYFRHYEATGECVESNVSFQDVSNKFNPIKLYCEMMKKDAFWLVVSILIIRRDFLIDNNLYFEPGIYHEDELWGVSLFLFANGIKIFDENIFYYRIGRENSITSSKKIKKEFDKIWIIDEFYNIIESTNVQKEKKHMLKIKSAVIEWGLIQDVGVYEGDSLLGDLKNQIQNRVLYLKYGKYIWGFLACKLLGIDKVRIANRWRVQILQRLKYHFRCGK